MNKILYVTDLDGTLLNSKTELSSYSESKMNYLINQNVNITVASLRSIITISQIFKNVSFQLPVIEMNGAYLTDLKSNNKLLVNTIHSSIKVDLLRIAKKHSVSPIIHCYHGEKDLMYIGEINNSGIEWYHNNRVQHRDPRLKNGLKLEEIMDMAWIGMTIIDEQNKLDLLRKEIDEKYKNVYTNMTESLQTPGYKWFTLNSENANKRDAIISLKNYLKIQDFYTVVFGDQPIDIPMFTIADLSVAVENAHPDVKSSAEVIIDNNDCDSVINFIENHYNENKK